MKRTVIFAHYDKDCLIDDYVLFYLKELKKCCGKLIFVSDSNLPTNELEKVNGIADDALAKRHGEYDFGSYKRGLEIFYDKYFDSTDELVLCNDSCYGGVFPFCEVFESKEKEDLDFWGLVESVVNKPHLKHIQSFFIVFRKPVFSKDYFKDFFKAVEQQKHKYDVVSKYEIELSQKILKHTTKYSSVYNEPKLLEFLKQNKKDVNTELKRIMGHKFLFFNFDKVTDDIIRSDYLFLLFKMRCPVFKTSLEMTIGLSPLFFEEFINNYTEYNFNLIKQHQDRISPVRKSFLQRLFIKTMKPFLSRLCKLICVFAPSKPLRQKIRNVMENCI